MPLRNATKLGVIALACALGLLGAGGCLGASAPTVTSTDPANGAVAVAVGKTITAAFSQPMNPATINVNTFTLKRGTAPVTGTVSYSGTTASFNPAGDLAPGTRYTATLTTDVGIADKHYPGYPPDEDIDPRIGDDDDHGHGHGFGHIGAWLIGLFMLGSGGDGSPNDVLAQDVVWSFTTSDPGEGEGEGEGDTTAPAVIFTFPLSGAAGVPAGSNITGTFSEAMNATTINNATFTLARGTALVPGDVSYSGNTAVFNPSNPLSSGILYSATISTGAEDLAGNGLVSDVNWTFTVAPIADNVLPAVLLTVPADDAADYPRASNVLAAFSEAMDPATITTATVLLSQGGTAVPGTVNYAGSAVTFDPANTMFAGTRYTATITTGAQDLAGNGLAADYVWSFVTGTVEDTTNPAVVLTFPQDDAELVSRTSNLVAIFDEVMAPATISTSTFRLAQGVNAIAGTVSYAGATATFNPDSTLAANTVYTATITTGAQDLAGNGLVENHSWRFSTGPLEDTTAPRIVVTIPQDETVDFPRASNVLAFFDEAMDPLTLNALTFTLTQGGTRVSGTVSYGGTTATFNPATSLLENTQYTATISTGAQDLAGNGLAENEVWVFTTGPIVDTIAPRVVTTIPAPGEPVFPRSSNLVAVFSEIMEPVTLNAATFTLASGGVRVPGAVSYAGATATFNPSLVLAAATIYTATITTGARDLAGNPMTANYVWSFTTGPVVDTSAPTVLVTVPVSNQTAVPRANNLSALFSEAVDPTSVNAANFTLTTGNSLVPGLVSYAGTTATFNPNSTLLAGTLYTATLKTGIRDLAGNPLAQNYVWTFTTGVILDNGAPVVTATQPLNNALGVPLNAVVTATFSEAMDPSTITSSSFTVEDNLGQVPGVASYADGIARFTPAGDLIANTTYTATLLMEAADLAGNPMAEDKVWQFTTGITTAMASLNLRTLSSFAVLAGSTVTNTGPSIVTGDLGVSPGTAVEGFPPGVLNGSIFAGVVSAAGQAKEDLTAAFNEAAGRSTGAVSLPGNLSGLTFYPGLYTNSTSVMLSVGNVTLDAQGDSEAVFLFQLGSTLTSGSSTQVVLAGGAKASNIYWQVGTSATLGTNSIFRGNILSEASITLNTGATLEGRALTSSGAVTLDAAVITTPAL